MKRVYLIKENKDVLDALDETYEDIFAVLKHRTPNAESLIEDEELFQLHELLALLRLGYLKSYFAENLDGQTFRIIEINDSA